MQRPDDAAATFAPLRPRLTRIAYRMLGSVAEAEDIVQDAYLRWHGADRSAVTDASAFLSKTVTRLCLDHLKSARVKRETYIGPWVPEPMIEPNDDDQADDITLTLMMALERLSPLERAAFLLHDVFGQNFDVVAQAIDRDAAACRQLASRAREHVRSAKPRFPVSPSQGADIAKAFFDASRTGEVGTLQALLAKDVVLYSDGGGKRIAALHPIHGDLNVARFVAGVTQKGFGVPGFTCRAETVDGLPGLVMAENGEVQQTMAFEIDDGQITAIYVVRNPDKLKHVSAGPATPSLH
ncbi:sigma-70 family RNA polymerase sigma factor [Bradyrhizobium sp. LHD-71]|uniref:sigma-70 family RNA polymerase sigma factor n=1 Tax=Bradyrhizobium sp. LHD-71 TaxID=3072141 RepID=UPI00280DC0B0|nr:sigma-70 family RNA polymerase sigma factor [Bradyrhizobium sp. LHD-71]MDQ8730296.1 sigma-70 family RNA polymerase sigma factor [Bradyrhizobium sp. LHD-71]